ncbi:MAG TPA: hypothetical protein VFJ46_16790, partial [Xanthobacteraceae bacterium]|nr:hypothetical protein [Xanthobacteraceae bacterium]
LPPVSRQVGLALRLALLTAARASEIAGARKCEFENLDKPEQATWLVPGERAKNKIDHLVPLAPLAVEAVESAIEFSGDSDFLFPTRLGRGGPIDRHTLTVAMVRFAKGLKGPGAKTLRAPGDCDQAFRLIATSHSGRSRPACGRGVTGAVG